MEHGLFMIMGKPVIVQLYAFSSPTKLIKTSELAVQSKLPSDVMFDNLLFYGEYEIIGHEKLAEEDFEFPISYGRSIDQRRIVFLQWGLIHLELPIERFDKYVDGEKAFQHNPYGYYSVGFRPGYNTAEIAKAIENKGVYDFANSNFYKAKWDLRNPKNKGVKEEIFRAFGLNPDEDYVENCKLSQTIKTTDAIEKSK